MKTIGVPSLHWLYTRSPFLDADYAAFRGMSFRGEAELKRFVSDEASALRGVGREPQSFSKDHTKAIEFARAKAPTCPQGIRMASSAEFKEPLWGEIGLVCIAIGFQASEMHGICGYPCHESEIWLRGPGATVCFLAKKAKKAQERLVQEGLNTSQAAEIAEAMQQKPGRLYACLVRSRQPGENDLEEPDVVRISEDEADEDEAGDVKQGGVMVQSNAVKVVRQDNVATSREGRKKPQKTATRVQREKKRQRLFEDEKEHFLSEAGVKRAMTKAIESCQTQATVKCNEEAIKDLRQCSEEFVMRVIWVWEELAELKKDKVISPKSIEKAISMHLHASGFDAAEREATASTTFLNQCFSSYGLKCIVQRSAVDPLRTT